MMRLPTTPHRTLEPHHTTLSIHFKRDNEKMRVASRKLRECGITPLHTFLPSGGRGRPQDVYHVDTLAAFFPPDKPPLPTVELTPPDGSLSVTDIERQFRPRGHTVAALRYLLRACGVPYGRHRSPADLSSAVHHYKLTHVVTMLDAIDNVRQKVNGDDQ
jgi:hypothetical protein